MNPFEEGGNDRDPTNKVKDNLRDVRGPMTRPKIKMMKQSLPNLSLEIKENLEQNESKATPKWVAVRVTLLITLVLPTEMLSVVKCRLSLGDAKADSLSAIRSQLTGNRYGFGQK
ncbi:hypothetical protein CR513_55320, partial [Mucuna pruriens]